MNFSRARRTQGAAILFGAARLACVCLFLAGGGLATRLVAQTGSADIPQFDVFPGFDRVIPEGDWFPVVCEIRNEGPTFIATFEIRDEAFGNDLVRRVAIELPTGTLKRFSFPMFGSSRWGSRYAATLRNEDGQVVASQSGITPRAQISWTSPLLGALPASASGMPVFPERQGRNNYAARPEPTVARLQPEMFPDNPIALDGLDALYLNSQRAVDLKDPQVEALMSWLHAGGRLIIGVDAVIDVNGVPWLKGLVPGELGSFQTLPAGEELDNWLHSGDGGLPGPLPNTGSRVYRELRADPAFNQANVRTLNLQPAPGARASLTIGGQAVAYRTERGRGSITVLLFNPEVEPFRSWKNRPWFWARLAEIPGSMLEDSPVTNHGAYSLDSVLGAIVDSRQVRKLPVSALLLLLIAYLVIIGPFDQWILKRINRQMLTWITFPCYVVLFSVLIWVIGYKLRAGESEWNELQIVDVIPKGNGAEMRGTTYASIYSPVNASYGVAGIGKFAALRAEYGGTSARGGLDGLVTLAGDSFKAGVSVPVWTSQMLVGDWVKDAPLPFSITVRRQGDRHEVAMTNHGLPEMAGARIALEGHIYDLNVPPKGQTTTTSLAAGKTEFKSFVVNNTRQFVQASQQRQQALGQDTARYQIVPELATMAISIASFNDPNQVNDWGQQVGQFLAPGRLDLSALLSRNHALALVWCEGFAQGEPMNDFQPRRSASSTLLRLAVPLNSTEN
ncbi:MAG TPA: hypothetical protein DCY13_12280 [Verrucomicrobiales bacterium]|nr:hypothetical protein [Verrucomicrobiales bacterium]